MESKYKKTLHSCYLAYTIHAIVNNYVPLLLLTFQSQYGLRLSQITFLLSLNFMVQFFLDLLSARFIDKIGYRVSVLMAHIFIVIGFAGLISLPELLPVPFYGFLFSVAFYSAGGGLLEVLLSPMVEALPTENKEKTMSLLHSFYSWGQAGVILISVIFFSLFSVNSWKLLVILWICLPVYNIVRFAKAPILQLVDKTELQNVSAKSLFYNRTFWFFALILLCGGACELAAGQWASTFAEQEFGVQKSLGDLFGPLIFAVLAGISRTLYGHLGEKINLRHAMLLCSAMCAGSYILIGLSQTPVSAAAGFALCGLSIGILWPGAFSMASASLKHFGTMVFALLALTGDIGCSAGPGLIGTVSSLCGDNLRAGMLSGAVFPIILVVCLLLQKKKTQSA